MAGPSLIMYEEEFNQINKVLEKLTKEANAKIVFLVDKNGQLIAAYGETKNIDTTSLFSGLVRCLVLPINFNHSMTDTFFPFASGSYVIFVLPWSTSYSGKKHESTAFAMIFSPICSSLLHESGQSDRALIYTKPSFEYSCAFFAFLIMSL